MPRMHQGELVLLEHHEPARPNEPRDHAQDRERVGEVDKDVSPDHRVEAVWQRERLQAAGRD